MAWYQRVVNVFRRDRLHHDIQRELGFHVAERVDQLRASGLSQQEAEQQAREQFGNFTLQTERTSDMAMANWLESMLRNVRHAIRTLARTPAFAATVILTLALGIGANSSVFSAIHAVLLQPLPFPAGDQLVVVQQHQPTFTVGYLAPIRLEEWNRLNSSLQGLTGYYLENDSETSGELPERLKRALVAPRFLQVLGIAPELGRDFSPAEEHYGGPNAVLISDRLWRRRFGADPSIVGKQLRFGRSAFPIVGVMPAAFVFPSTEVDLWSPSPMDAPYAQNREETWFSGVGRLRSGVSAAQAQANLMTVQASLGKQFPKTDAELGVIVQPLKETTVEGVRRSLWFLFGSVSLLLLIACINIASLLLSRATQQQQEISVRFALGASRGAIVAQLLTEVMVLAIAGAGLGLLVAAGTSTVFRALAKNLPRIEEIHLDWRIVLYSLACALTATLISGLLPALRSTRRGISVSLMRGGRAQLSSRNPIQLLLVGVQVAFAVTLLAGAGLLFRSLQELGRIAPGFNPNHVLAFQISSSWGETADYKGSQQRVNRILESLRALPGVQAATVSLTLPGVPSKYQTELKVAEGRAESDHKIMAESRTVPPSYFGAMQIPLVAGELCREEPGVRTMVVNRSFEKAYFPSSSAIGRHLLGTDFQPPIGGEIRGVVGDAREIGLQREPVPTAYWCSTAAQPGDYYLVRTAGDPMAMAEVVRRRIHEMEPLRSVFDVMPLEQHLSDAIAENRMRTILLSFFAVTAVSLACIGLYGMLNYFVNVRRREVGLRLALGAMRGQIVKQFLMQGLGISMLGSIAGVCLALASARVLAGMLYGVSPSDAPTLSGVVLIVLAVAALASLLPASRAARVEPMQVLRDE
jgi:putative ABC transport system permease protein